MKRDYGFNRKNHYGTSSTSEKETLLNTAELPAGVYVLKFLNEKKV